MALTVPVEAIEERAAKADPRRALLAALLLPFFVAGWVARKTWMACVFAWSAVAAGWQDAARPAVAEGDSDE